MNSEFPTSREIARFYNEYTILENLQIPWVRRVIRKDSLDGRQACLLEYIEGAPLSRYASGPGLNLKGFLLIASRMAATIHEVHKHHIIHRDIKPSNFIFNQAENTVHLIDFGLATKIDIKNSIDTAPDRLAGSLPYISPEQTGRMNRPVDYRSDIYSLGATYFYMLTGQPPFLSGDAAEIVHSHIARTPRSPDELNPLVPAQLARMVLKMLAKNAEERYQSGAGIQADLERCLESLRTTGEVESFEPGKRDAALFLRIPEKLFGREKELVQLMNSFHRASSGNCEMVVVSGSPGIGKSAMVMELYRPVSMESGYFLQGKFDRFQKDNPFHGIIQAIQAFSERILSEKQERLDYWKNRILEAVGGQGRILTDLIPGIHDLLGEQPVLPDLEGQEAYNRMIYIFSRFIQSIASEKHTMVLFLDDLQWADPASLDLIRSIMTDHSTGYLMIAGASRDNEVGETHPLSMALNTIRSRYGRVSQLHLEPLQREHILSLCTETFGTKRGHADGLASVVFERTGGNPFFVREFLHTIHERKLLFYDGVVYSWDWNLAGIRSAEITTNVIELLEKKILDLDGDSRKILEYASCMGSTFTLRMLSSVLKKSISELATGLVRAVELGIILPASDEFRFARQDLRVSPNDGEEYVCFFAHDRLQEAAYGLLPELDRRATHLSIARLLLELQPGEDHDFIPLVNQYNSGIDLIEDPEERVVAAGLNRKAGGKAKKAAAYESAYHYYSMALKLLPENRWGENYEFTLEVFNDTVETAFFSGRFDLCSSLAMEVLDHAKVPEDTLQVRYILLQNATAVNDLAQVLEQGRLALGILGIRMPKRSGPHHILGSMVRARLSLRKHRIEDLIHLDDLSNGSIVFALRIMQKMTPVAFRSGSNLFPVLIFTMANLTTVYGKAPISVFAYGSYAIALCGVLGQYEKGYRFGKMIMEMPHHIRDGMSVFSHSVFLWNNFIRHWKEPIAVTVDDFMAGYRNGFENGYLFEAVWTAHHRSLWSFFVGREMTVIQKQLEEIGDLVYVDRAAHDMVRALRQMILNLSGNVPEPWILKGSEFDETTETEHAPTEASFMQLKKLLLRFLFQKHKLALEEAILGEKLLSGMTSMPGYSLFLFLAALVRLDAHRILSRESVHLRVVKKTIKKFRRWAALLPATHQHRLELLEGELLEAMGKPAQARSMIDRAIDSIRKEPARACTLEEAIVMERAADFYIRNSGKTFASSLIQYAVSAYDRWGARSKIDELQKKYSGFSWVNVAGVGQDSLATTTGSSLTRTGSHRSGSGTIHLQDYLTIIKSAQAIAGEMVLDELLKKLMVCILENSGAKKGVLIINDLHSGRMQVRTTGAVTGDIQVELVQVPVEGYSGIPHSLVQFGSRTGKELIIDDLSVERRFNSDPYFEGEKTGSILCAPILYQGREVGLVYLENRLHGGVFDSSRMEILNIITGQAAISIHNSQLYESIQDAYKKERMLKDSYRSFVPEQFLKFLGKESILDIRPGDCMETEMSVLFADIRSFTSISESLTPEDNFRFLNEFFTHMNPAIVNHGGFIDKYIGDSIMALFPGKAELAVDAGLDMLYRLNRFNEDLGQKSGLSIKIGIGINTGKLMLGTIGTADRMDSTVISDAVNIASRVESTTKTLEIPLLVTGDTIRAIEAPDMYHFTELDSIELKGKSKPVPLFEVQKR